MEPQLVTYHDPDMDIQQPFDVAVVIPTLLRPTLADALKSVFAQDIKGTVQILVGIDRVDNSDFDWEFVLKNRPKNMALTLFWPGYSTNGLNGGLHNAMGGGALRSLLSFLANSRSVAYLDDDNWFSPNHLSSLKKALAGKDWAFSSRWFVDETTRQPLCLDSWESVGPHRGIFASNFDGFVDTNCLMVDVERCLALLSHWCRPLAQATDAKGADRNIFSKLKALKSYGSTDKTTVSYCIQHSDLNHQARLAYIDTHKIATGHAACTDWVPPPDPLPKRRKKPFLAGNYQLFGDHSRPFDIAVVMPTIGRIDLLKALRSVKKQRFNGRVQILIGIDKQLGDVRMIKALGNHLPANMGLVVFDPGYSTSKRHGGIHRAFDGGSLRTILSLLAHAPYVAYLDDDNSWHPDHLSSLYQAIAGHDYAYSLRRFIHPDKITPVSVDHWESVGPGKGFFSLTFGGFVDPNCLMIQISSCLHILPFWTLPLPRDKEAMSADRVIFHHLSRKAQGKGTQKATVEYVMNTADPLHPLRMIYLGERWQCADIAAFTRGKV